MCLTVVLGRQATVDGSVLVGHNEENHGPYFVNFRRIHPESVSANRRPLELPEPLHRPHYGFFWSQIPGREFSDNYLNEAGVAIVSNGCPSREDDVQTLIARGEILHGGMGGLLRRLVAEQARTAQEGVELIGRLVEEFGYRDSGRTYVLADPQEAWVVAVVRGRRWLAQRVPDDAAVVVPNVFIFEHLETRDSACSDGISYEPYEQPLPSQGFCTSEPPPDQKPQLRCSADLVSYAIHRGWYVPESGERFSFRQAYQSAERNQPDVRQGWGQQLLLRENPPEAFQTPKTDSETGPENGTQPTGPLPWYVRPKRKFHLRDVAAILRNQQGPRSLFHPATQETAVFQLRSWLPPGVGCVYWRTVGRPDWSLFLPWYLGVREVPVEYCHPAFRDHVEIWDPTSPLPEEVFQPEPKFIWWKFQALQKLGSALGEKGLLEVRAVWDAWEDRLLAAQPRLEEQLLQDWPANRETCLGLLSAYCKLRSETACTEADRLTERLAAWTASSRTENSSSASSAR